MAKVVVELTNRCQLACRHCFSARHAGGIDLPVAVIERLLAEAKPAGFDKLAFTGGDPLAHPGFAEIVSRSHEAGYRWGFVTNGWSLPAILPRILPFRASLTYITFSVDGATALTHDTLRGRDSYRRVMAALSACVALQLPFTFNMVVTAVNLHEVELLAQTAVTLGAHGVRFEHLLHSPETTRLGWDLTPAERKAAEARIWRLEQTSPIPIALGPGHYTTSLFPCAPLHLREVNVDCRGNLTLCCHLSGHGPDAGSGDVAGSLIDISFADGLRRLQAIRERVIADKMRRLADGQMIDSDYFPCWSCFLDFQKVEWLREQAAGQPWASLMRSGRRHAEGGLVQIGNA